jgi:hypothetical protein
VSSIALGWCLQYRVHLAVILVLNFWVGFGTGALATCGLGVVNCPAPRRQ